MEKQTGDQGPGIVIVLSGYLLSTFCRKGVSFWHSYGFKHRSQYLHTLRVFLVERKPE